MITKINNKYYDLTNFKHPGGYWAFMHAKNRDATILFNSYHPFSKDKILKSIEKYRIEEPKTNKIITPKKFEFDTPFSKELNKEVQQYFLTLAKQKNLTLRQVVKADTTKWIFITITTSLHLISLYYFIMGYYFAIILEPILGWISGVNYFHDANHFALSRNTDITYIFSNIPIFFSQSYDWIHQHNIGHHSYTNIDNYDPDVISLFPNAVQHGVKYNIPYYYTLFFIWSIIFYDLIFMEPTKTMYNYYYHNKNITLLEHSLFNTFFYITLKLLYIVIYFVIPLYHYSFPISIFYVYLSRSIFSWLFALTTQISHNHIDFKKNNFDDWSKHQVINSCNYATNSIFWFYLSGGLTHQIEHHLFPFINHCHLPNIQPIVKRICKKHDVNYLEFPTYQKAFNHYVKYLLK